MGNNPRALLISPFELDGNSTMIRDDNCNDDFDIMARNAKNARVML